MHLLRLPNLSRHRWGPLACDPVIWGTLCGLVAAVGYTAANICLRAVAGCDPIWVSCVKAFPTVVLIGPWLLVRLNRGQPILPPARVLGALLLAGLVGQLAGNVLFQWSLGVVGIALAVPLTLGTIILSGALLGRIVLGEPVTARAALSMLILLAAIAVLSAGSGEAHRSVGLTGASPDGWPTFWLLAAGLTAACLSGLAYSILGVVIRYHVTGQASLSTTLVSVGLVGVLSLGALSHWRLGAQTLWNTPGHDMAIMLLAGVCNAVAFLALTKALQLTSIVYVNALNATQATMAAVAGVLLFSEARSTALLTGVLLTILGLLLMQKEQKAGRPDPSAPSEPPDDRKPRGVCCSAQTG